MLLLSCEKEIEIEIEDDFDACSEMDDLIFKNYCIDSFDLDNNGKISMSEANQVSVIYVNSLGIKSLKGIECFRNLTDLRCCENNLEVLDISKNTELIELYCTNNNLTDLSVKSNLKLNSLDCCSNNLSTESLNSLFESLPNTKGQIYFYNNYGSNDCKKSIYENKGWSGVGEIDDVCSVMDDFYFKMYCYSRFDTNKDGKVSISEANAVKVISVEKMRIRSLKGIEFFTNLTYLKCSENVLKVLYLSKNTALTYLFCNENSLTNLDVSKNTALTCLFCNENSLTNLDVSKNTELIEFSCGLNYLTDLDVSQNVALTILLCNGNELTNLDISQNVALTDFFCNGNKLINLDFSQNVALTTLFCNGNELSNLDFSQNIALNYIYCSSNNLSTEALNSLFESLSYHENGKLKFSNNPGTDTCDRSIYEAKGWTIINNITFEDEETKALP